MKQLLVLILSLSAIFSANGQARPGTISNVITVANPIGIIVSEKEEAQIQRLQKQSKTLRAANEYLGRRVDSLVTIIQTMYEAQGAALQGDLYALRDGMETRRKLDSLIVEIKLRQPDKL